MDIWVTSSRSCGEYLPQISPHLALVQLLKKQRTSLKGCLKQFFYHVSHIFCITSLRNVFLQMYSCKFIPVENVKREAGAIPWVKLS